MPKAGLISVTEPKAIDAESASVAAQQMAMSRNADREGFEWYIYAPMCPTRSMTDQHCGFVNTLKWHLARDCEHAWPKSRMMASKCNYPPTEQQAGTTFSTTLKFGYVGFKFHLRS